jgi:cytochrome c oxidase assembly factor CtaG
MVWAILAAVGVPLWLCAARPASAEERKHLRWIGNEPVIKIAAP